MQITRSTKVAAAIAVTTLVGLAAVGCNIVGPAYAVLSGPPTVDPVYDLPDVSTVVFVDDRGNQIPTSSRMIRLTIADRASQDLMVEKVLTRTISPRDAMGAVMDSDRYEQLMPIDAIGRAVGADVIIYVEMLSFSAAVDTGTTPQPTANFRLRVIDVTNRVRLFPDPLAEEASIVSSASLPMVDPSALQSTTSRLKIYEALAEKTGEEIARLFYKHEARELGGRLGDRS